MMSRWGGTFSIHWYVYKFVQQLWFPHCFLTSNYCNRVSFWVGEESADWNPHLFSIYAVKSSLCTAVGQWIQVTKWDLKVKCLKTETGSLPCLADQTLCIVMCWFASVLHHIHFSDIVSLSLSFFFFKMPWGSFFFHAQHANWNH